MRKSMIAVAIAGLLSIGGLSGCSDKTAVEKETKVTGPGGTTTATQSTEVKTTGESPPPLNP